MLGVGDAPDIAAARAQALVAEARCNSNDQGDSSMRQGPMHMMTLPEQLGLPRPFSQRSCGVRLPKRRGPHGCRTVPNTPHSRAVAKNFATKRASLAGARYDPHSRFDRHVETDSSIFDATSLMRFGT